MLRGFLRVCSPSIQLSGFVISADTAQLLFPWEGICLLRGTGSLQHVCTCADLLRVPSVRLPCPCSVSALHVFRVAAVGTPGFCCGCCHPRCICWVSASCLLCFLHIHCVEASLCYVSSTSTVHLLQLCRRWKAPGRLGNCFWGFWDPLTSPSQKKNLLP